MLCYLAPITDAQARRVHNVLCDVLDEMAYNGYGDVADELVENSKEVMRDYGLSSLAAMSLVVTARVAENRYKH